MYVCVYTHTYIHPKIYNHTQHHIFREIYIFDQQHNGDESPLNKSNSVSCLAGSISKDIINITETLYKCHEVSLNTYTIKGSHFIKLLLKTLPSF